MFKKEKKWNKKQGKEEIHKYPSEAIQVQFPG